MLEAGTSATLGWKKVWQFQSVCEINAACCVVLSKKLPETTCVHHDIFEPCDGWELLCEDSEDVHARFRAMCQAFRTEKRRCKKHQGWCRMARPTLDVSGTPCQPWSRAGCRRGAADARSNVTLAYLSFLHTVNPILAVHENVQGFSNKILEEVSELYEIHHLVGRPSDAGFATRSCLARPCYCLCIVIVLLVGRLQSGRNTHTHMCSLRHLSIGPGNLQFYFAKAMQS